MQCSPQINQEAYLLLLSGNFQKDLPFPLHRPGDDAAIKTAIQNNKLGSGTAPTDFDLVLTGKECGNFIVVGALEKDISYDESTGTLTFLGNSDASVFLKSGLASSNGKIVILSIETETMSTFKLVSLSYGKAGVAYSSCPPASP